MRGLVIVALLGAVPSWAQVFEGDQLQPVFSDKGLFTEAVVGASVVTSTATVAPSAGAVLDVVDDAELQFAQLLWWGSADAPDRDVAFTLPGGTTLTLSAQVTTGSDPCSVIGTVTP